MLKHKTIALLFAFCFLCTNLFAQESLESYIEELKAPASILSEGVWGLKAQTLGGTVLAEYNGNQRLVPASNLKLITTGTALMVLGEDYRFTTTLAYEGEIRDSILFGDLIIIGGADPTTGADDDCSIPTEELFSSWKELLLAAGIKQIEGFIVPDDSYFDGEPRNRDWSYEDIGFYYGSGPSGLNFNRNSQVFIATPGAKIGDPVVFTPGEPLTPWMAYDFEATTGPAGTGDKLYYTADEVIPAGRFYGTLGIDSPPRKENCANLFGALTCAHHFSEYLNENSFPVSSSASTDSLNIFSQDSTSLVIIGETQSRPLIEIVKETNHESDNFYAETLLRQLGKSLRNSACYDSALVAQASVLESMGVPTERRAQLRDGSGLARTNYLSPDFIVDFLCAMSLTPQYESYLESLPKAGEGTLVSRLASYSSLRNRVYMKSGSMNGVRCYSGYILSTSGKAEDTIAFSILTNNITTSSTSAVNRILDRLIYLISIQK